MRRQQVAIRYYVKITLVATLTGGRDSFEGTIPTPPSLLGLVAIGIWTAAPAV
jgi:hypothetical protein